MTTATNDKHKWQQKVNQQDWQSMFLKLMKLIYKLSFFKNNDVRTKFDLTKKVCDVANMAKDVMSKGAVEVGLSRAEKIEKIVQLVTNT